MFTDERPGPDRPVECRRCGLGVLVRKHSLAHTMVQWPLDDSGCERALRAETTGLLIGCPELSSSVREAVLSGRLEVPGVGRPEVAEPQAE